MKYRQYALIPPNRRIHLPVCHRENRTFHFEDKGGIVLSISIGTSYHLDFFVITYDTINESKKDGKDQETILSSTCITPDPGYHMGK